MYKSERVIGLSWVDLNNTVIDLSQSTNPDLTLEALQDKNFNKRLLLITNRGM